MKNGKKQYYWVYTDPVTGQRKSLSGTDPDELDARVKAKQADLAQGINPCDQPFGVYLEWHLEQVHLINCRPATAEKYRSALRTVQSYPISQVPVSKLDDRQMQVFYSTLFKATDSADAVKGIDRIVKPCIRYAAIRGDIRIDFMPIVKLPKDRPAVKMAKRRKREERPFSQEDERIFTDALMKTAGLPDHRNSDNEALFLVQLRMGLRIGELLALTWEDVTLDDDTPLIDINKQFGFRKVKGEDGVERRQAITGEPKSEMGYRVLAIPPELIPIVERHKETQKHMLARIGIMQSSKTLVFGTLTGEHKEEQACNKSLKRLCGRLGIAIHTTHDLRHTFGTRCFEAELDAKTIQVLLGDSSMSMMMNTYIHVSRAVQAKKISKLNEYYAESVYEKRNDTESECVPIPCRVVSLTK